MLLGTKPAHLLSEPNKREGVRYAFTKDGVELPVVDTTHPAFALEWSEEKQKALETAFLRQNAAFERLPSSVRRLLLAIHLRKSLLARGIRRSRGSYLSALDTYLLKLGPDNLPSQRAVRADREIAGSLPATAVRLRLQDVAQLTAHVAAAELASAPPDQPLYLLNIGSGPAIDSLNALLILQGQQPKLLQQRTIVIQALEFDDEGVYFGRNALDVLRADTGPLHGLEISLRHTRYDWTNPSDLLAVLEPASAERAVVIASSEGALFEYGSDNDIIGSLNYLRSHQGRGVTVVGSVTRNDPLTRALHGASGAAVHPRGLAEFARLAAGTGYSIACVRERPLSDQVVLVPDRD